MTVQKIANAIHRTNPDMQVRVNMFPHLSEDPKEGRVNVMCAEPPRSVLWIEVDHPPKLEDVQAMVDGYIELVVQRKTISTPHVPVQIVCNEEGRLKGLAPNYPATIWCENNLGVKFQQPLVGNIVILSGRNALMR